MIEFEKDEYCQITGWSVRIGKWDVGDAAFVPTTLIFIVSCALLVMTW